MTKVYSIKPKHNYILVQEYICETTGIQSTQQIFREPDHFLTIPRIKDLLPHASLFLKSLSHKSFKTLCFCVN